MDTTLRKLERLAEQGTEDDVTRWLWARRQVFPISDGEVAYWNAFLSRLYEDHKKQMAAWYAAAREGPSPPLPKTRWQRERNRCPACGGFNSRVDDYDRMWQDGKVVCADCNMFIRDFDAG